MQARDLEALIERHDPAWPRIVEWTGEAHHPVEILSVDRSCGERTLLRLQVSTRSVLGAIALESGGLLFDHGWLRLLGAGSQRLSGSLLTWNGLDGPGVTPAVEQAMLVAHDAVGGFFAINGATASEKSGRVFYFAPDTLHWEDLDMGYSQFVHWATTEAVGEFYASLRWPQWQDDMVAVKPDHGFSVYPFLWTEGPPVGERSRRVVPMTELWTLHNDLAAQLGLR